MTAGCGRVYGARAVYRDGSPIAGASFAIGRGIMPTAELALVADEYGRFYFALPRGCSTWA